MKLKYVAVCVVLVAVAGRASVGMAAPVVFNTGVDGTGMVLTDGSVDPHYAGTGGVETVNSGFASPLGPSSVSAWVQPTDIGTGGYDVQTTFTLATTGPVTISGRYAAAERLDFISFNSIFFTDSNSDDGGVAWHDFTVTANGIAGTNALDFRIYHAGGGLPLALRAEITSVVVPEPAGVGGVVMAAGVGAMLRRRRV